MSNVSVYSFADASGLTQYVDSQGDFLFTGTWSSSGTYTASPLMAAHYGPALYMAVRDNVGDNPQRVPTRVRPQSWSILSLLYEYQSGTEALTPAESTANAAWELAQTGTNVAEAAYALAVTGTGAANQALDILSTRWSGTVTVWAAGSEGGVANVGLTFINGILSACTPA